MKNLTVCSINLECPQKVCPNRSSCEDAALAWELPFYRNHEGLFVKPSYRTRWQKQAHNSMVGTLPYCPLPSGDYLLIWDGGEHEYLIRERIQESLNEAGWAAAISLPTNNIGVEDEEVEEIC
ncbi:hypothetical protein NIES4071_00080 [Calothrix sp. NIES-4071]|nr:hypothetical protein NIES4071_00080 [Calothrix sp. NIES-4071]BAZ54355.1 hypothetical protein NIES4105_00080 [Calothrix sp. NIES-4105]